MRCLLFQGAETFLATSRLNECAEVCQLLKVELIVEQNLSGTQQQARPAASCCTGIAHSASMAQGDFLDTESPMPSWPAEFRPQANTCMRTDTCLAAGDTLSLQS